MTFEHIVLFRLFDGVDPKRALDTVNSAIPDEALVWVVEESLDRRKGVVIAERAVFTSVEAFEAWRESEAHRASGAAMATMSDWIVADFGA